MNRKKTLMFLLLGLVVFLPFIPYLSGFGTTPSGMAENSCIFCAIANGTTDTKIEVENSEFVIFKDIKPASDHHYLAVTKHHVESLTHLTKADDALVARMEAGLKKFYVSKGIDTNDALFGFHLPPFISVKHLHMHGIAPRSSMTFLHRMIFKAGSAWFKTVDEARKYLMEKE